MWFVGLCGLWLQVPVHECDVVLLSYEVLRRELSNCVGSSSSARLAARQLPLLGFWRIVLDEAQLVANSNSVAAQVGSGHRYISHTNCRCGVCRLTFHPYSTTLYIRGLIQAACLVSMACLPTHAAFTPSPTRYLSSCLLTALAPPDGLLPLLVASLLYRRHDPLIRYRWLLPVLLITTPVHMSHRIGPPPSPGCELAVPAARVGGDGHAHQLVAGGAGGAVRVPGLPPLLRRKRVEAPGARALLSHHAMGVTALRWAHRLMVVHSGVYRYCHAVSPRFPKQQPANSVCGTSSWCAARPVAGRCCAA